MFKILICDDQPEWLQKIRKEVDAVMSLPHITETFPDAYSLFEYLAKNDADILITDIRMPHADGIALANAIHEQNKHIQIIFITSYDYIEDVFSARPVFYLKKPLHREKLHEALSIAISNLNELQDTVTVEVNRKLIRIAADDIEYAESRIRDVIIHGKNEVTVFHTKLDTFAKQLPSYFLRIHKSYIINMNHIKSISDMKAEMISGEKLPIPKTNYSKVRKAVLSYWDKKI